MSQENVDLVRQRIAVLAAGFDHGDFERGDFDAFFEWLDPEIEWRGPREFPDLAERVSDTRAYASTSRSCSKPSRTTEWCRRSSSTQATIGYSCSRVKAGAGEAAGSRL